MEKIDPKFEKYMEGILSYNEHINLTAITDREEFIVKHYLDSLLCTDFPEYEQAEKIIDVGTGAGFPGVPLAIRSPEKSFVLMDSLKKRLKIVDELCGEAGITNVTTLHGRAEDLSHGKAHREKYDLSVSRAVARLSVLAEYCLPFIKVGGYLLAYKGPEAEKELKEAEKAIALLGGKGVAIRKGKLEEYGIDHNIIVIEKISPTPAKYPRKAGTPAKEPL